LPRGTKSSIYIVYTGVELNTRLQKWGNSLAVRIPKAFADEMKLGENASLHLEMKEGSLLITPVKENRWTLESLLSAVSEENKQGEWETGDRTGNEEW
jgi:antitoxin MazE